MGEQAPNQKGKFELAVDSEGDERGAPAIGHGHCIISRR